MVKTDFIPLDYDNFDFNGKNYIRMIGRNSKGKSLCVIDTCPVYLWAVLKSPLALSKEKINSLIEKIKKIQLDIKGRKTKVENVEIHEKKFLGRSVKALKIFATNYKDLHGIASELDFKEIECRRGHDLGFVTHYIIEKKISPLNWYEISGEFAGAEFQGIENLDVDSCIVLESSKEIPLEKAPNFKPKVLSYDIETDGIKIGEGEILMVSLSGEKFKKVITWKKSESVSNKLAGSKKAVLDYVEYVKDEAELIEKFVESVKKFSPDFLVGYFSDGFDLPYLRARAQKLGVPLALGIDGSQPRFSRSGVRGGFTAKISGVVHIDILKFIQTAYSQYMQSETLSLKEVSKEFLGDTKKDFKIEHSSKIQTSKHWEEYYEYCLQDSFLTLGLFEKMWQDLLGFTHVIQEPIFDISRNGMSSNVEDFLIHNLERFNEIPEKRPTHDEIGSRRQREKYVGAFVFEPIPGLYENISVFDFTSFWPSIIVTFNLSKSTLLKQKEKNSVEAEVLDKKVYFTKTPGFFPELLKEIVLKRKQYKKELAQSKTQDAIKKARSNAYKLLANASYGYMGFFGARYYCPEASGAATAISRRFIKETIDKIDHAGYKTIYSDTDSIALLMNKRTESQVLKFLEKLNSDLPGIMELELEGFFKRGIWVTKRAGGIGAKKKYALIDKKGKLKIRGFETVRRDWCPLARQVQNNIIRQVLEDGNEKQSLKYVKEIVKKIKQRGVDKKDLIIKTMLQKPLDEYKAISPHVIAARKMKDLGLPSSVGSLIEYYISEPAGVRGMKKALVRDRVKLPGEPGEYDIDYYLEHQILPAVENIFQVFDVNIKEVLDGKRQTTLGDF
ncbi:MAG: DNA-directed DNA polymerase [Nanoarchaeota archaeon]